MRKKVGIVTITKGSNYGNRLQNYAMQTVLQRQGYYPETIQKETDILKGFKRIKFNFKNIFNIKCSLFEKRMYRFFQFNKRNITFSKKLLSEKKENHSIAEMYDYFVCGSDQIWNPYFSINTDLNYLSFVSDKKKVAVSASFGVDNIPVEKQQHIKELLEALDAISMREYTGEEIVKKLTNKSCITVIDPTLALSEKEWEKMEKAPKSRDKDKKYNFCYLLGNYDISFIQTITNNAKSDQRDVAYLWNEFVPLQYQGSEFAMDPSEFVWLIHHCEKVITDSFHAVVFSLIFHKPFIVVPRSVDEGMRDMSSRFKQLEKMFDIKDMLYNGSFENCAIVDYDYVERVIEKEQKRFIEFIKNSLK